MCKDFPNHLIQSMNLILILCLPALIFCEHIEWQSIAKLSTREYGKMTSLVSPDGSVHLIFQALLDGKERVIQHRKFFPSSKTLTAPRTIGYNVTSSGEAYGRKSDAKISTDGKHIAVVYVNDKEKGFEISFVESLDGGNSWSRPINVTSPKGAGDKFSPSIVLEDTGRVHIAYGNRWSAWISTRESGSTEFALNRIPIVLGLDYKGYLGFSIDRKESKRYLHFVWVYRPSRFPIYRSSHMRSEDGGKTWSKLSEEDRGGFSAIATSIDGAIYTQQSSHFDVSTDHGESWDDTLKLNRRLSDTYDLAMCGQGPTRRLLSFAKSFSHEILLHSLKSDEGVFRVLEHPFAKTDPFAEVYVGCGVDGEGRRIVTLFLAGKTRRPNYMAYGVLKP